MTIFDPPPEVVNPVFNWNWLDTFIKWDAPVIRSTTTYGSGWVNNNMAAYTGSKVNDGDSTSSAFTLATAGDGDVSRDFTTAILFREWWLYYLSVDAGVKLFVEWSDNNIAWTKPVQYYQRPVYTAVGAAQLWIITLDAATVAHRYWRVRKDQALNKTTSVSEVWPRTYGNNFGPIWGYRIYAPSAGLLTEIDWLPTTGSPLSLSPAPMWPDFQSVTVVAVTPNREAQSLGHYILSTFIGSSAAPFDFYGVGAITLANGVNSNIALTIQRSGSIVVSGPGAGFSLGGFNGGQVDGSRLRVDYFGAQACTIIHEDAASTAAYRINIPTAVNLVLAAGKFIAEFVYDGGTQRWWLAWARDSGGPK